jgi:hypothetical protein
MHGIAAAVVRPDPSTEGKAYLFAPTKIIFDIAHFRDPETGVSGLSPDNPEFVEANRDFWPWKTTNSTTTISASTPVRFIDGRRGSIFSD